MCTNPQATSYAVLGEPLVDWEAAKAAVTAFLGANTHRELIEDLEIRAVHSALADDQNWNGVMAELGITYV